DVHGPARVELGVLAEGAGGRRRVVPGLLGARGGHPVPERQVVGALVDGLVAHGGSSQPFFQPNTGPMKPIVAAWLTLNWTWFGVAAVGSVHDRTWSVLAFHRHWPHWVSVTPADQLGVRLAEMTPSSPSSAAVKLVTPVESVPLLATV